MNKFKPGDYVEIERKLFLSVHLLHGTVVETRTGLQNTAVKVNTGLFHSEAIIWMRESQLTKRTEFERIILGLT